MRTVTSLAEVATDLENHANSGRIKKLIFSICQNQWENDLAKIERVPFVELIQQFRELHSSLDKADLALDRMVKTLNKSTEYALVAQVILQHFRPLYRILEEPTQILPNATDYSPAHQSHLTTVYDPFRLRLSVMQYTTPLRAKIVLFSALYHPFGFRSRDWIELKNLELDYLLLKIFRECESAQELEKKLTQILPGVPEKSELLQAASAIIQALTPLYPKRQIALNQASPYYQHPTEITQLMPSNLTEEILADWDDSDDDEEATCQFFIP
ncbi:MAG: hypothetical protein F6K32_07065 [Desertifilum sp. SIO1I2]|nr:hypothetical protein [Desertifilum sp. SIO1I2]